MKNRQNSRTAEQQNSRTAEQQNSKTAEQQNRRMAKTAKHKNGRNLGEGPLVLGVAFWREEASALFPLLPADNDWTEVGMGVGIGAGWGGGVSSGWQMHRGMPHVQGMTAGSADSTAGLVGSMLDGDDDGDDDDVSEESFLEADVCARFLATK